MKKIDNKTWDRFAEAYGKIGGIKAEIEALIEATNEKLAVLAEQANAARELAYAALDEAAADADTYFDERSEKWQESDAGSTYSDWKDELANARDVLGEDVNFAVEAMYGIDVIDGMLEALDGGFRQSPDE